MLVSYTSDYESHHKWAFKIKRNNTKCWDKCWRYSRGTARVRTKPRESNV